MDSFNDAYTTSPDYGSGGTHYKPKVRTESSANYIQTRPSVSRSRETDITLNWPMLDATEYGSIIVFFDDHQGTAFYWTDPRGVTRIVGFKEDGIKWEWVEPYGYYKLTVVLEEY
jgi:phage-related protein